MMPVAELIEHLQRKAVPDDAIAVTFDDGYEDNLLAAKPVLARYEVPATVFIATGYTDRREMFWWDELATMILESPRSQSHLVMCDGETIHLDWRELERADLSGCWRGWQEPMTSRQRSYLAIWRKMKYAGSEERTAALADLRSKLGAGKDSLAFPLTTSQIKLLLADDWISLGAHTVTHPALTGLSEPDCLREMQESGDTCRALSGKAVEGFAYPYGDADEAVRVAAAAAGFSWACSTESTFVDGSDVNTYGVPRLAVPNVPARMFSRMLSG